MALYGTITEQFRHYTAQFISTFNRISIFPPQTLSLTSLVDLDRRIRSATIHFLDHPLKSFHSSLPIISFISTARLFTSTATSSIHILRLSMCIPITASNVAPLEASSGINRGATRSVGTISRRNSVWRKISMTTMVTDNRRNAQRNSLRASQPGFGPSEPGRRSSQLDGLTDGRRTEGRMNGHLYILTHGISPHSTGLYPHRGRCSASQKNSAL